MRFADVDGPGMTMPPQPSPGIAPGIPTGPAPSTGRGPNPLPISDESPPAHDPTESPRLSAPLGLLRAFPSPIAPFERSPSEVIL